jgi:hypothetical protein
MRFDYRNRKEEQLRTNKKSYKNRLSRARRKTLNDLVEKSENLKLMVRTEAPNFIF